MNETELLDEDDRRLLNRIQSDFPLDARPFRTLAAELGLEERDVIERVRRLRRCGIIRRIGGNFVPGKLSYVSTLCAAQVPEDRIDAFAAVVNRYPGVTHNYQRDGEYNVWFTFIAPSPEEIAAHLDDIAAETGVKRILNLPATHLFKIRAQFEL
jgi:DNA-binding Lrp family transcriptional regulator